MLPIWTQIEAKQSLRSCSLRLSLSQALMLYYLQHLELEAVCSLHKRQRGLKSCVVSIRVNKGN